MYVHVCMYTHYSKKVKEIILFYFGCVFLIIYLNCNFDFLDVTDCKILHGVILLLRIYASASSSSVFFFFLL